MHTVAVRNKTVHRAASRGYADHGWLKTYHTFSFADYYDPRRIHFGALRVLNDDTVAPGEGFGPHPHADMEIVTIPLEGVLEHSDSMGHTLQLRPGEVQVMSAGTGVLHGEYNGSETDPVKFLQVWVLPDSKGYAPRYERIAPAPGRRNALRLIVAPEGCGGEHAGWIHQRAWFYTLHLEAGRAVEYRLNVHGQGAYVFVVEGRAAVAGEELGPRDGMGVWNVDEFLIKGVSETRLLVIEVPMK